MYICKANFFQLLQKEPVVSRNNFVLYVKHIPVQESMEITPDQREGHHSKLPLPSIGKQLPLPAKKRTRLNGAGSVFRNIRDY